MSVHYDNSKRTIGILVNGSILEKIYNVTRSVRFTKLLFLIAFSFL